MSNGNYIKLHRSLMEWEWYGDSNTTRLFIHMLLKANWKEGRFEGVIIPRGSFASSLQTLADESGLSVMQIRTAIKHLKLTGEITSKPHRKFTVFSIVNYSLYQSDNSQDNTKNNNQVTASQQGDNKMITTIEEREERKKERNNKYTCAFEEFWQAYPRKKDKGNAFKKFNARLNNGFSEEELIGAAKNYAAECQKNQTEEKYIKHPATFLSDSLPFQEYLEKGIPKFVEIIIEEDEEEVGDDW